MEIMSALVVNDAEVFHGDSKTSLRERLTSAPAAQVLPRKSPRRRAPAPAAPTPANPAPVAAPAGSARQPVVPCLRFLSRILGTMPAAVEPPDGPVSESKSSQV